jgi:hypothetical protein
VLDSRGGRRRRKTTGGDPYSPPPVVMCGYQRLPVLCYSQSLSIVVGRREFLESGSRWWKIKGRPGPTVEEVKTPRFPTGCRSSGEVS